MLPGFRFLFAAILLTLSVLVFGLGAAALLRASHEQFASSPARRALPEPVFAQQLPASPQPAEPPAATLAMLRVEPVAAERTPESVPAAPIAAPAEPAPEAVPVPPVQTERLAALKIEEPQPELTSEPVARTVVTAKPAPAPPTETAPMEAAPVVQAETPAVAEETKIAAVPDVTPPAPTETAPAESAAVAPTPEPAPEPTRIAALSPPAAVTEPTSAKPKSAEVDRAAVRKRLRAQRAKERRRLAAQRAARQARQAAAARQPVQAQADPFTVQPTITTATPPRSRRR